MDSIKRKFSSRKFWASIIGVITGIIFCLNGQYTEGAATVCSSIIGYMVAEGYVDGKAASSYKKALEDVLKMIDTNGEES